MKLPERPRILFAHSAYRLGECFARRGIDLPFSHASTVEELRAGLPAADVLVLSGFWKNDMIGLAPRLRLIQACSSGTDFFDIAALKERGIRLASAAGANANAVSEHAIGLLLALTRLIHTGRDNQQRRHWRGMISDIGRREEELPGKTLLLVGLGKIGGRIARLAKAFDMHVIGVKRNTAGPVAHVDELISREALMDVLPRADVVVLACPLNEGTRRIIDRAALAAMKRTAYLINVARGGCVEEAALIEALREGRIAGAGIDVTDPEPPDAQSPLWSLENVILTPHTGGETRAYEENVIDLLVENLAHHAAGRPLRNEIA